ncbi:MAG: hypothetical protein KatS3mg010_2152 [Acidimicrobiia bacterium]|nr:MAG: hypothetical protein KatS3mg010_2152 [Acidimicrobiia bacterium]
MGRARLPARPHPLGARQRRHPRRAAGLHARRPYTARPPARPYAREVGADPGRLRVGLRTEAAGHLAPTDPECVAAAEDAARLLESLGHTVEVASPAALDEAELMRSFSTIMLAVARCELDELAEVAGRPVEAGDVEPLTWMYYEMAKAVPASAYVRALDEARKWTRPRRLVVVRPRVRPAADRRRWPSRRRRSATSPPGDRGPVLEGAGARGARSPRTHRSRAT